METCTFSHNCVQVKLYAQTDVWSRDSKRRPEEAGADTTCDATPTERALYQLDLYRARVKTYLDG